MLSLYEYAGGREALRRFIDAFYTSVLADSVLQPLFGAGRPEHVDQLTAFDTESFGGPDDFTRTMGGFAHLIEVHRRLHISEAQRRRFVELYLTAADTVELPADPAFRQALRSHVEFGSQVAMQNSHAHTDDELHPLRDVPHWQWPHDMARPDAQPSPSDQQGTDRAGLSPAPAAGECGPLAGGKVSTVR